jgi:hypothetical protein
VFRPHDMGHIASLAVNQNFRGLGVAQGLMRTLHQNFASHYGIDSASLYCRVCAINIIPQLTYIHRIFCRFNAPVGFKCCSPQTLLQGLRVSLRQASRRVLSRPGERVDNDHQWALRHERSPIHCV